MLGQSKGSHSHVIKLKHVRSFEWSRDTHGSLQEKRLLANHYIIINISYYNAFQIIEHTIFLNQQFTTWGAGRGSITTEGKEKRRKKEIGFDCNNTI